MCGIFGAIAGGDVAPRLLEGLQRLEYRGYDSAGIAVLNGGIHRLRRAGRVADLESAFAATPCAGSVGVAHTRWATHGAPDEANAHPHISQGRVALVHNGVIENYEELKRRQLEAGFTFGSQTDTEALAHQIMLCLQDGDDLTRAVARAARALAGSYAVGAIDREHPGRLVAARHGSPLLIGFGEDGNYISSDMQALLPLTRDFVELRDGEIAELRRDGVTLYDADLKPLERERRRTTLSPVAVELGDFDHFMIKEIHEQPRAVADTLEGRLLDDRVPAEICGPRAAATLEKVECMQIAACGSSYHAALIARYWMEELAGLPCRVEIASEWRYRRHTAAPPGCLFVTISQSGETADTLAALRLARERAYLASLAVCNVPGSSLTRESDLCLMTHAGPEIGVASTKAFTTQLVALLLLVAQLRGRDGRPTAELIAQLRNLPARLNQALALEPRIKALAAGYAARRHALFLGRGHHYPVALEGALKMKEVSYIHAEGYPAGELKHGPLALVDADMPVVAVAPNDRLLGKLKSNLKEVQARGGRLHVFADAACGFDAGDGIELIELDAPENAVAPIIFTAALQLLAYHTALAKGTDMDKPRNLAKSVTVE